MEFSNERVLPSGLPQLHDVTFLPLETTYLKVLRISHFLAFGLLWIACAVIWLLEIMDSEKVLLYIAIPLFVLTVISYLSMVISFRKSGYALREHDILVRRGWFLQRTRVVPMNRVQHVSIQAGPLERKFGLAEVSVYTAATSSDISIRGLKRETAEQIREWISSRINEQ